MQPELLIALVGGAFAVGGVVLGALLTYLGSYFEHRRKTKAELEEAHNRELAVLHGAFAVTNFINSVLNEWDQGRNVYSLARLVVAQPYIATLIERSPPDSDRLMVSLIDVGLRLEALMFVSGFAVGSDIEVSPDSLPAIERSVEELSTAVELVEIIVTGELPMMTDEELAQFPSLGEASEERPSSD